MKFLSIEWEEKEFFTPKVKKTDRRKAHPEPGDFWVGPDGIRYFDRRIESKAPARPAKGKEGEGVNGGTI